MRASSSSLSLFVVAWCAAGSCVSAHGFLSSITINGKTYNGNNPFRNNDPSVIRKVSSPDPNYGASNTALTCGPGALAASQMADANPGDTMTFDWRGADYSHWPHNTGPMLTYMASCGSSSCDQFDPAQAKWFKIRQVGRKNGNPQWVQQDVFDGGVDTVTIPSNLAPGNYLVRHEIIALHLATQRGGAEFYPGCAQVRIGGSQTGKPSESELVSFPGAYSDDDPGIYDPSVYNTRVAYVFPGPRVAAFVGGSSGGATNSTSTTGTSTPTQTGVGATPSSVLPKSSGRVCRLKKRPGSSGSEARYFSRAIHRAVFSWNFKLS
jgi:hypothetical protein